MPQLGSKSSSGASSGWAGSNSGDWVGIGEEGLLGDLFWVPTAGAHAEFGPGGP
jgi:hypothetical protein